ncbi:MAG: hypothetical protein AAB875_05180 [Patescibacteria group bacterium]
MSKGQGYWIIGLLVFVILFLFIESVRPVWDYTIISFNDSLFEKSINEMGCQGWELVSARRIIEDKSGQDRYEGILKMKKY